MVTIWIVFILFVLVMLALDLGVFNRKAHVISSREAVRWVAFFVSLALVFNGFELGAIMIAILIANYVIQDGESTWFEGVQLLAVYLVFGLAFYFA